jgi:acyl carrier protein
MPPSPTHIPNWCPFCGALLVSPSERSGSVPCASCQRPLWYTKAPDGVWFHDPAEVAAIRERVVRVLSRQLGMAPERITDAMTFTEDIGADTLDIVETVMELEEEFGVTIPDGDAERLMSVGDVVSYLVRRVS